LNNSDVTETRQQSIALTVLITLYALGFTNLFLRNSLGIMAPSIAEDMVLSPATLSLVASSFFLAYGIMQIPSGMMLDRFGARRTLAFLLIFTMAGAATFSMAENASQLILARVLMGIGCAGIFSGAVFVINEWVTPDRMIVQTTILNSFAAIGGLCATAPLAAVLAIYDWRLCFWVFTIGVSVILLGVIFSLRDPPQVANEAPKRENLVDILAGVRLALVQPGMARMLVIGIPLSAQTTIMGVWGAPYLRDVHQLGDVERGGVLFIMALTGVAGHSSYGLAARFFNSVRITLLAGSTMIVGLLVALALAKQPPLWLVTSIFGAIGYLAMYPMLAFAHARALVPSAVIGRGVAVTNMGIMSAIALMQLLFGWMVGFFPAEDGAIPEVAYRVAFGGVAALSIVAILIYAPIKDYKPRG